MSPYRRLRLIQRLGHGADGLRAAAAARVVQQPVPGPPRVGHGVHHRVAHDRGLRPRGISITNYEYDHHVEQFRDINWTWMMA